MPINISSQNLEPPGIARQFIPEIVNLRPIHRDKWEKIGSPPTGSDSSSSSSSQFTTPMHKQTQFHPSLKAMGEAGKEWPSGAGKYKKVATMSTGWSLPGSELRGETHTGKAFILSLRAGDFCISVCVLRPRTIIFPQAHTDQHQPKREKKRRSNKRRFKIQFKFA